MEGRTENTEHDAARHQEPIAVDAGIYRGILDAVSDGVYVTDCDRRILYWNPTAQALTGYEADTVLGTRCFDDLLKHVDSAGKTLCTDWRRLCATGSPERVNSTCDTARATEFRYG